MTTLEQIYEHRVVAILRGAAPTAVARIVEALATGGIRLVEITLNTPDALSAIAQARRQWGDRLAIGAGTVMGAEAAREAIGAGAAFIISPIVDEPTIEQTKALGAVSIPGAFTPTEIWRAHRAGGDIIKVFPGNLGPDFLHNIRGPFPDIPLMPTGGVQADNVAAFRRAGAVAFGVGSALVDTRQPLTDDYLQQIIDNARAFVQAASH